MRLFLEETFGEGLANAPPEPAVRPDEITLVRRLTEINRRRGVKAREYLVRVEME